MIFYLGLITMMDGFFSCICVKLPTVFLAPLDLSIDCFHAIEICVFKYNEVRYNLAFDGELLSYTFMRFGNVGIQHCTKTAALPFAFRL